MPYQNDNENLAEDLFASVPKFSKLMPTADELTNPEAIAGLPALKARYERDEAASLEKMRRPNPLMVRIFAGNSAYTYSHILLILILTFLSHLFSRSAHTYSRILHTLLFILRIPLTHLPVSQLVHVLLSYSTPNTTLT
jgi:hypothetical protein